MKLWFYSYFSLEFRFALLISIFGSLSLDGIPLKFWKRKKKVQNFQSDRWQWRKRRRIKKKCKKAIDFLPRPELLIECILQSSWTEKKIIKEKEKKKRHMKILLVKPLKFTLPFVIKYEMRTTEQCAKRTSDEIDLRDICSFFFVVLFSLRFHWFDAHMQSEPYEGLLGHISSVLFLLPFLAFIVFYGFILASRRQSFRSISMNISCIYIIVLTNPITGNKIQKERIVYVCFSDRPPTDRQRHRARTHRRYFHFSRSISQAKY